MTLRSTPAFRLVLSVAPIAVAFGISFVIASPSVISQEEADGFVGGDAAAAACCSSLTDTQCPSEMFQTCPTVRKYEACSGTGTKKCLHTGEDTNCHAIDPARCAVMRDYVCSGSWSADPAPG